LTHRRRLSSYWSACQYNIYQFKRKGAPLKAARLFLLLQRDTAFRMQGIECSLFRVLGQIFAQKLGVQESQPNHTVKQGKRQCIRRLQGTHPSLQRWLFHESQAFAGTQLVPKLYVRYVRRQLGVWIENQGQ